MRSASLALRRRPRQDPVSCAHDADVARCGRRRRDRRPAWPGGSTATAGAGPTLLLVHGFRGDHHGLEPVISYLPGVHMIAPDLPGFGASAPLPGEHSIDGVRGLAAAFAATIGLPDDVVVIGHSFGTIVAPKALADGLPAARRRADQPDRGAPALAGPNALGTRLASLYFGVGAALPERLGAALLQSRVIGAVPARAWRRRRTRRCGAWIHNQHDRFFSGYASRRVVRRGVPRLRHARHHRVGGSAAPCPCTWSPPSTTTSRRSPPCAAADPAARTRRSRDPRRRPPRALRDARGRPRSRSRRVAGSAARRHDRVDRARRRLPVHPRDGRHDGISRYTAGHHRRSRAARAAHDADRRRAAARAAARPALGADSAAHRPLEPLIAEADQPAASPTWCSRPMQTSGSLGRRYGLVLTLHDLIYYRHRTPPPEFAWWVRLCWRLLPR